MLAILATVFLIQYLQEKNIKKVLGLIVILVLTALFGACTDEIVERFNNDPPIITQNKHSSTNKDFGDTDEKEKETITSTDIRSIGDFFYFLSPMARKFVQKRDKTYSPDWLLILLSIIGSIFLITLAIQIGSENLKKNTLPKVLLGIIFIVINFYFVFFFASAFSIGRTFGYLGLFDILMVITVYWMLLIMFILLIVLEVAIIAN